VPITAQHVHQVEAEAKKIIVLRNTAGKTFKMALFIVTLHITMYFLFVAGFGDVIGTQKFMVWKHTWHTEVRKMPPSFKSEGTPEYEAWLKETTEATPSCQPDGSKNKKDWRDVTPQFKPEGTPECAACSKKQPSRLRRASPTDRRRRRFVAKRCWTDLKQGFRGN